MPDRQPRGIRIRDQEGEKPGGAYAISAWCTNCEWTGEVEIPKGTAVSWEAPLERLARCEICGCETLRRNAQPDEEEEPDVAVPAREPIRDLDAFVAFEELIRRQGALERQQPIPAPTPIPYNPYPSPLVPSPLVPSPLPPSFPGPPNMPHVGEPPSWHSERWEGIQNALKNAVLTGYRGGRVD